MRRSSGRFGGVLLAAVLTLVGVAPVATADVDTTPPVLRGVYFDPLQVAPGGTVTITLDAVDDTALRSYTVRAYEVSTGRAVFFSDSGSRLSTGLPVTTSWANGMYGILDISLFDAAGNSAIYRNDGSLLTSPPSSVVSHQVDVRGAGFTVSGASDLSPPVLDSFYASAKATVAGSPSTFEWRVSDSDALASMALIWDGLDGQPRTTTALSRTSKFGPGDATVPLSGRWRLSAVELTDVRGNTAVYNGDGTVSTSGVYGTRHALGFGAMELALAPTPPAAEVRNRPGRLSVLLPGGADEARLIPSYTVTAQPSGRSVTVDTTVASRTVADLTGLPNGTTQTVTVVAHGTSGDSAPSTLSGRPVLSRNVTGVADLTRDVLPDVVAQREAGTTNDDGIVRYAGTGRGALGARTSLRRGSACQHIGPFGTNALLGSVLCQGSELTKVDDLGIGLLGSRGWGAYTTLDGGHDLTSDGRPDLVGVDPAGVMRIWPQTSKGRLGTAVVLGSGWQAMIAVVSAGDLTGDRRGDLVAVDASGRMWLYAGNGRAGFGARRQIGSGWAGMGALFSLHDLDRDGRADLGGVTADGRLLLYRGTGAGSVRSGVMIGSGWDAFL